MTTEQKSMQRCPRSQKPEKIIYCNWLSLMCLLINVQHVVTMFRGDFFFCTTSAIWCGNHKCGGKRGARRGKEWELMSSKIKNKEKSSRSCCSICYILVWLLAAIAKIASTGGSKSRKSFWLIWVAKTNINYSLLSSLSWREWMVFRSTIAIPTFLSFPCMMQNK